MRSLLLLGLTILFQLLYPPSFLLTNTGHTLTKSHTARADLHIPPGVYIKGDKNANDFIIITEGTPGKVSLNLQALSILNMFTLVYPKQIVLIKPVNTVKQSAIKIGDQLIPYSKKLTVKTTAYSSEELASSPGAGDPTITATGHKLARGIVAVDPRLIPLGTCLYIPGYGFAKALDTGGNIRQKRIDLAMDSTREALQWGVRTKTVYIIDCKYTNLQF